jgi:hypothetical protein
LFIDPIKKFLLFRFLIFIILQKSILVFNN